LSAVDARARQPERRIAAPAPIPGRSTGGRPDARARHFPLGFGNYLDRGGLSRLGLGYRPDASLGGTVQETEKRPAGTHFSPRRGDSRGTIDFQASTDPGRSVTPLLWLRPSATERQRAVQTLRSLGTTSIPGLAAALAMSVRRTHRILQDVQRRGPPGLVYEPRSGAIRWEESPRGPAGSPEPTPPAPAPRAASGGIPRFPSSSRGDAHGPPAPAFGPSGPIATTMLEPSASPSPYRPPRRTGPVPECRRCRIPLVPSGSEGEFACPMCGRRVSGSGDVLSIAPSTSPAAPAGPDRKLQELLAAWAIGQPVSCPKCRRTLRKDGVGSFHCPACGESVRLTGVADASPRPPSAPAAPAASSATPAAPGPR
jgi:predicted RNA-binding Zn-ribbon protein involved in translation (DUF1610 family)